MSEDINTPEAVPSEPHVSSEEGGGADNGITLEKLTEVLGKEFKDADSALKSIKDTYGYVGSQAQYREKMTSLAQQLGTDETGVLNALQALAGPQKSEVKADVKTPSGDYVPRSQYEQDQFFASNKELSGLKEILIPLKNANPEMSWSDLVKQPHVEQLIEKDKAYSEIQDKKSVVESNPRIGAASDKVNEARKALKDGDGNGARKTAVSAVLDTMSG